MFADTLKDISTDILIREYEALTSQPMPSVTSLEWLPRHKDKTGIGLELANRGHGQMVIALLHSAAQN